ncbi:MAG: ABC transporter permease [Aldersonia sp.]|nr:ABC transporter permease [Aldersonia sp.]
MFRRSIRHTLRTPETMILGIALPIVLMLMFVYVFGGAMDVGGDYLDYVVPGIILLCASFGSATTATSIAVDMTEGIVDRFRTMAIAKSAVLTGHVGASLLRNLVTSAIVVGVGLLLGFRPNANLLEWLAAIGVVAMFILAISWFCVALGLIAGNAEAASGFTFFLLFLPYVSSAFVPTSTMPSWLHWFADNQPVTPVIETMRGLLMGTPIGNSAVLAVCWCAGIALVGFVWSGIVFRRKTAR